MKSTEIAALLDRTVHLNAAGGQYDGRFTVTDARRRGDGIQLTGTWHAPSGDIARTVTVRPWCIHDTRAEALDAAIGTRKAIRTGGLSPDEIRALAR